MDKQDPAARGANPAASQLSHPAMKQSADFIESRSGLRGAVVGSARPAAPGSCPSREGSGEGRQERLPGHVPTTALTTLTCF